MELIEVVDGGLLTMVQDLGRYGYQRYGVPVSGAMDPYALRMANLLLGNSEGAAALEITLVGPKLKFLADGVVALGGADMAPRVNGQPVATWRTLKISKGSLLTFDGPMAGTRVYLAVNAGIDVPKVMGSRSTYLKASLGGFQGRILRAGDRISAPGESAYPTPSGLRVPTEFIPQYGHLHQLRVVMGPQAGAFTHEGVATFLSGTYTASRRSDRVGGRLEGPSVEHLRGADIISDGTAFGSVQITGDGLPIVLLADRGTTGGYAKIATIISVDVGKLAQALPGDEVTFKAVSLDEAHRLLAEREEEMDTLREHVVRARERDPTLMRVTSQGQAFEVVTEDGDYLTQTDSLDGETVTLRRTVNSTVDGQTYTFQVETEESL